MSKIFISFKNTDNEQLTEDYFIANQLAATLRKNSVDVFFSETSLLDKGKSDYKTVIDSELDTADVLVLVGTKAEYINSPWVRYEWDNFLQNIISGIKPESEIFCLFSNIRPEEKPLGIRFKQTFPADSGGISSILEIICSKINVQAKKLCNCKNCGAIFEFGARNLCRYHPKEAVISKIKNFDGTEQKFWIFPCCNKKLVCNDENKKPSRADGCVIGKHTI